MEARYETHRLIKELQREKRLETQAKQEQALPVTQDVRSKPEKQAKQEQAVPVTQDVRSKPEKQAKQEQVLPVTQDVRSKQSKTKGLPVTVPQAVSAEEVTVPVAATAEEVTAQAAKFKRWQRLSCCWKSCQS